MKTMTLLLASLTTFTANAASAASISGQGTWETTLQGRDLDGDLSNGFEVYYDIVLDITWLANANAGGTTMNWATANAWAAGLDVFGITGWRLPNSDNCNGLSCTGSEMGNLFYAALGNTAGVLTNTGPFSNVQSLYFSIEIDTIPESAWDFDMSTGIQGHSSKTHSIYAWAVHDGDVGASVVPIPAAAWLLGSGLVGLIGVARSKATACRICG